MTRAMAGATRAELGKQLVEPFLLVEALFDGGPLRFWTGGYDLSWNGKTWLGAGDLLGVEDIAETSEVSAPGIKVTLSGVPSTTISLALSEPYQGRSLLVYLGFLSAAGVVVQAPVVIFSGRMDQMRIREAGEGATVELSAENRLVDLERANERRYTHEDQQIDFPGDKGLEFISGARRPTGGDGYGSGRGRGGFEQAPGPWTRGNP